jgi:release factor glutamine methyltransferase
MARTIAEELVEATARLRDTSATPRLDAEILLAYVLGWSRVQLLAASRDPLPRDANRSFDALVARRANLEPVAYLVGQREFFGLTFAVDRRVLVPRPETELLVELALKIASERLPSSTDPLTIADVGTGSGAIAVALAVHLPEARIIATDRSPDALDVARANAERHGILGRVMFAVGDLLAPLAEPVDLLVSNPPYTVLANIDEGVRRHEPHLALDGGSDGLDLYRRLLAQAPAKLRPGGIILLEIGAHQGQAVQSLAQQAFPHANISVHTDLAGHNRVIRVTIIHGTNAITHNA